jgi:solute carrier family 13 (sodium-dependent dicarboxylate transporter), member 2/3/5
MTPLSEAETAPRLSIVEGTFGSRRQAIGLITGPVLFALALLVSPPAGVPPAGMRTLGVFLLTVTWWISEAIPIPATSLLAMALLALCGILPVDMAFSTWANPILLFLLGAFIIGHAMNIHGLTRRIAYRMATLPIVAGNPWRLLVLFGVASALLSSLMSHVVMTMVFLSIAIGMADSLRLERGNRYAEALFLCIAWGANLGIGTPVGAPTNLIAIGMAASMGYRVGFVQWMLVSLPVLALSLLAMFLVVRYVLRPQLPDWHRQPDSLHAELKSMGVLSRGERIAGCAFLFALFLWMLPDLLPVFLSGGRQHPVSIWVTRHLDWSVTALVVAASLFVIPLESKTSRRVMTWDEAVRGVDWGTLSLIAAALALGNTIASSKLGLGTMLETNMSALVISSQSQFLFVLLVVAFTIVVGSFVSNLAIVSLTGSLVQALGPSAPVNPIALLVTVGIAANMDFALPIGTPPSAMVFASGYVGIRQMMKGGIVLTLFSIPVVTLAYYLANWILPWPRPL